MFLIAQTSSYAMCDWRVSEKLVNQSDLEIHDSSSLNCAADNYSTQNFSENAITDHVSNRQRRKPLYGRVHHPHGTGIITA